MRSVNTGAACTGACCEDFTLVDGEALLTHAQHAATKHTYGVRDLARLAVPALTEHRFHCTKFDPRTRLCTDYANRPDTCRTYPMGAVQAGVTSDTCRHCGLTTTAPNRSGDALGVSP